MDDLLLTLDVDWAPDFVIDHVAELLVERGVRATWFITHSSPALQRLRRHPDLFEIGIHPNFLTGSTHGSDPTSVLKHCLDLVPEARSMRTHSLVQSTPILDLVLSTTGISTDVSLFLPRMSALRPVDYWRRGRRLLRVPYFWEDDFEIGHPAPLWELGAVDRVGPGLKIFDFHPLLVYLNSMDLDCFEGLKRSPGGVRGASVEQLAPWVRQGPGPRTLFLEIADCLRDQGRSRCIRELQPASST